MKEQGTSYTYNEVIPYHMGMQICNKLAYICQMENITLPEKFTQNVRIIDNNDYDGLHIVVLMAIDCGVRAPRSLEVYTQVMVDDSIHTVITDKNGYIECPEDPDFVPELVGKLREVIYKKVYEFFDMENVMPPVFPSYINPMNPYQSQYYDPSYQQYNPPYNESDMYLDELDDWEDDYYEDDIDDYIEDDRIICNPDNEDLITQFYHPDYYFIPDHDYYY